MRILYPQQGAVYYADGSLPREMQAIRVEIEHPRGAAPGLLVNGIPVADDGKTSLGVVTSWIVPLTQGPMLLEAHSGGNIVSRRIEVR
jgi:hypothetical protein